MKKWKYLVAGREARYSSQGGITDWLVSINGERVDERQPWVNWLTSIGREGWQLIAVEPYERNARFYFAREG